MLIVFWDMKGPISIDFLEKGAAVNSAMYCQLLVKHKAACPVSDGATVCFTGMLALHLLRSGGPCGVMVKELVCGLEVREY